MKNLLLACLLLTGCAGTQRGCSADMAESFGGDWIIVQYQMDGNPFACWQLKGVSVTNEPQSDGIFWQSPEGHLIHISGWYNRVQVENGDFDGAAKQLGIVRESCHSGRYGE